MEKKSFRFKVLVLFFIPIVGMIFFAGDFLLQKYDLLRKSELLLYISKQLETTSKLIHTIQIERGISAGYIVSRNDEKEFLKRKLTKQCEKTDNCIRKFFLSIDRKNNLKEAFNVLVDGKNEIYEANVKKKLASLAEIRQKVLRQKISFEEEIAYYSTINSDLLRLIYLYKTVLFEEFRNSALIYKLEMLKELAGLERAYVFYYLLSKEKPHFEEIIRLQAEQNKFLDEILLDADITAATKIKTLLASPLQRDIDRFRRQIRKQTTAKLDARLWFEISTRRIDAFEKISLALIEEFNANVEAAYKRGKFSLFVGIFFIVLFLFSLVFLVVILKRLIDKEETMLEDLRIASYTFDSQEAVSITDAQATILRVNKAFTEITGYTPEEVIGKKTNILKSGKHPETFYQKMWTALLREGKWSGEIFNKRKNGEIYPEKLSITAIKDENGTTTHYIAQFIDIGELKEAEEKAIYQASHDFLTKLPNRKSMIEKLKEEFIRAKRHAFLDAFLFLDLDGFKKINDTYGHAIGDAVLVEVAKRLRTITREDDYIARISGDEFCVILVNLDNDEEKAAHDVKTVCEHIIESIARPIRMEPYTVYLGVSIGVRLFPDKINDINDIINGADTAMYKAKENGKNQYVFFNEELEHKIRELTSLEQELNEAFYHKEFVFYFQPKVSVLENKIEGAELLVRWEHPTKGLLYPDSFIDVVKEMGQLTQITFAAIETACVFLARNTTLRGTLSINVSSFELISEAFIDQVLATLRRCGVDPSRLEFEILENELIENFDLVVRNIKKLRSFGMKISIDDFGTGYSSISYLRKLPVDIIKIDRYFVQNLADEANKKLVAMIIDIAKSFEFNVVVEGVETQDELEFIRQNEAEYYQGYYFSKPIPQEEFEKLLQKTS